MIIIIFFCKRYPAAASKFEFRIFIQLFHIENKILIGLSEEYKSGKSPIIENIGNDIIADQAYDSYGMTVLL